MDEQMNDASFDREIESLLAVEPSPEFVARVRARVAEEPEPRRWWTSWTLAVAGAVAVVILAVIAWPSREPAASVTTASQSRRRLRACRPRHRRPCVGRRQRQSPMP